jgi:hypothetical protein
LNHIVEETLELCATDVGNLGQQSEACSCDRILENENHGVAAETSMAIRAFGAQYRHPSNGRTLD